MPTPTYTPLANITLGSGASSVTFSSISQSYRDLVLIINSTTDSQSGFNMRFNNDSAVNYNWVNMVGDGSGTSSSASTESSIKMSNYAASAGQITSFIFNIMDYSATDKHKTILHRTGIAQQHTSAFVNRWGSTSAINGITFSVGTTFTSGTSFSLYGIAA